MKRQRKIRVAAVDHSACLFVQTFVNFIELSLSLSLTRHISPIGRFDGRRRRSRSRLRFRFQLRFILETI